MPADRLSPPDPAIQAEIDHLPTDTPYEPIPRPDVVNLCVLRYYLSVLECPRPSLADSPNACLEYDRILFLVSGIPDIHELDRWCNCELGEHLTAAATLDIRKRLSQSTRRCFSDVDPLRITDALALLGRLPPPVPLSAEPALQERDAGSYDPWVWDLSSGETPSEGEQPGTAAPDSASEQESAAPADLTPPRTSAPPPSPDPPPGPATPPSGTEAPGFADAGDQPADEDTESRVAAILREKPRAKSPAIARKLELDERTIRKTSAWKENRRRLRAKRADAIDRAMPLSEVMLAAIDSKTAKPDEIAAEREEQKEPEAIDPIELLARQYLEGADCNQKARFHRLSEKDKEHELKAWQLSGERIAD
jgi:hypothetical protein